MKSIYDMQIEIGQAAIGGLPISRPIIEFCLYKYHIQSADDFFKKREPVNYWYVGLDLEEFIKNLTNLQKGPEDEDAKESIKYIRGIFANIFTKAALSELKSKENSTDE